MQCWKEDLKTHHNFSYTLDSLSSYCHLIHRTDSLNDKQEVGYYQVQGHIQPRESYSAGIVAIYKNGLVMPGDFIKYFAPKTDCAPLLYVGNVTQDVVESVRNRTLAGMTFEGVVCKQNRAKTHHPNRMFKIKSNDWIAKVKSLYTDEKILKELLWQIIKFY